MPVLLPASPVLIRGIKDLRVLNRNDGCVLHLVLIQQRRDSDDAGRLESWLARVANLRIVQVVSNDPLGDMSRLSQPLGLYVDVARGIYSRQQLATLLVWTHHESEPRRPTLLLLPTSAKAEQSSSTLSLLTFHNKSLRHIYNIGIFIIFVLLILHAPGV